MWKALATARNRDLLVVHLHHLLRMAPTVPTATRWLHHSISLAFPKTYTMAKTIGYSIRGPQRKAQILVSQRDSDGRTAPAMLHPSSSLATNGSTACEKYMKSSNLEGRLPWNPPTLYPTPSAACAQLNTSLRGWWGIHVHPLVHSKLVRFSVDLQRVCQLGWLGCTLHVGLVGLNASWHFNSQLGLE
jgi:hypothetical protein